MKYYASYKPETGKTHIVAYDEAKRGAPRIVNDHTTFLYHNSIIVSRVYDTVADALLGNLGRYSNRLSIPALLNQLAVLQGYDTADFCCAEEARL